MAGEGERAARRGFAAEVLGEGGLADTGLPAEEDEATTPGEGGIEMGTQDCPLALAADEGQWISIKLACRGQAHRAVPIPDEGTIPSSVIVRRLTAENRIPPNVPSE